MLVCRNCKKIIMYSVNGYCEECITPERAAQQSVHADAGDSAASSELVHASAESTSQTVTQPTQRG